VRVAVAVTAILALASPAAAQTSLVAGGEFHTALDVSSWEAFYFGGAVFAQFNASDAAGCGTSGSVELAPIGGVRPTLMGLTQCVPLAGPTIVAARGAYRMGSPSVQTVGLAVEYYTDATCTPSARINSVGSSPGTVAGGEWARLAIDATPLPANTQSVTLGILFVGGCAECAPIVGGSDELRLWAGETIFRNGFEICP
jgi:hypothetical protein